MSNSSQFISANDERLIWSGAVSLQEGAGWVMPWRLPHPDLDLFPPETLHDKAATGAGVRLRFATDATELALETEPMIMSANLDLYAEDVLVSTVAFEQGDTKVPFENLPAGMKTVEVWLHQSMSFQVRGIHLPAGARFERVEDTRPKWITYGSSISHCSAASSPSFTWPGVVARGKGLNLTSLGFGGNCHAEPMVARLIRDLPADFVSLKLGINICGGYSLSQRTFLPAVIGTIATIREGHPEIPLVVCSPIWHDPLEKTPNAVGMTLEIMREELAQAVETFRRRGDRQIFSVNGMDLLGPELAAYLPDGLHPDAEGYRVLGENFIREVFDKIGVRLPSKSASGG